MTDGSDDAGRYWATLVFGLAIITDRYDGMIARRTGQVTEFGKLADPIADKALTGTALIGLSILDLLPWWVTLVILVREVGVTLLRFWVIRHGVIAASRGGKLKTVVQSLAIGLYILPLTGWLATARWWVMAVAVRPDRRHRARLRVPGADACASTSARAMRAAAARRAAGPIRHERRRAPTPRPDQRAPIERAPRATAVSSSLGSTPISRRRMPRNASYCRRAAIQSPAAWCASMSAR